MKLQEKSKFSSSFQVIISEFRDLFHYTQPVTQQNNLRFYGNFIMLSPGFTWNEITLVTGSNISDKKASSMIGEKVQKDIFLHMDLIGLFCNVNQ